MTTDPQSVVSSRAQAELELLQLMLQESTYPWNPGELEADAYFAALDQDVVNAGWSLTDLTEQGQIFATRLDQVWATVPTADPLLQRFATQVPQALLNRIAETARQVVSSKLSLADQLVQCVQDSMQWAAEDLQVLARPYAFAMRDTTSASLESALNSLPSQTWDDLSEIEQARMGLVIARYAIAQASQEQ
jgi:hypothetical protein